MSATVMRNVPLMKALVDVGARTDGSVATDMVTMAFRLSAWRSADPSTIRQDAIAWAKFRKAEYEKAVRDGDYQAARKAGLRIPVSDTQIVTPAAHLLVETRGDISKAFELAVKYEFEYAKRLYLRPGRVRCPLCHNI